MKFETCNEINIITFNSIRNNSIDDTFLDNFSKIISSIDKQKPLLIKGSNNFFCPGIDLIYTLEMSRKSMNLYIKKFEKMLKSVLQYDMPTFSYINGHSIAGGFALALSTDYRIVKEGNYYIGYNRKNIGINLPPLARLLYQNYISTEAKIAGLEHVSNLSDSIIFDIWTKYDDLPFNFIKLNTNKRIININKSNTDIESERIEFLDSWFSKDVVKFRNKTVSKMLK